jgi:hypothetical protein
MRLIQAAFISFWKVKRGNLWNYRRHWGLALTSFVYSGSDSDFCIGLELTADNATRWNSTYYMINRALRVEYRLRQFCQDDQYRNDLQVDTLTDADWQELRAIHDALEPFHGATQRLQGQAKTGSHGSIWEALPVLEALLAAMEKGLPLNGRRSRQPTVLEVAHQNAWDKLKKYYELTDACPEIYGAALLFHPCHRQTYFNVYWTEKLAVWKDRLLSLVKSTWQTEYCEFDAADDADDEPTAKRARRERSPDIFDRHMESIYQNAATTTDSDDFTGYTTGTRSRPQDVPNVIKWWADTERRSPLARMALDVLSIPAMSTECERLFSSASHLVGTTRYSLHDDTMEQLELMRQWLRQGIIQLTADR